MNANCKHHLLFFFSVHAAVHDYVSSELTLGQPVTAEPLDSEDIPDEPGASGVSTVCPICSVVRNNCVIYTISIVQGAMS